MGENTIATLIKMPDQDSGFHSAYFNNCREVDGICIVVVIYMETCIWGIMLFCKYLAGCNFLSSLNKAIAIIASSQNRYHPSVTLT